MRVLAVITAVIAIAAVAGASEGSAANQLSVKVLTVRLDHSQDVIRFFDNHRWMRALRHDKCWQVPWSRTCTIARRSYGWHTKRVVRLRERIEREQVRALYSMPAHTAICEVFGSYCQQALTVARCESGYSPNAANGQYLGIFQMGSSERAAYGHGATAYEQAVAAYRYFVATDRTWSPWSCKP